MAFPTTRLRRLRYHPKIRDLVREHRLQSQDFVMPLFIRHGNNKKIAIASMPGQFQWSIDQLPEILKEIQAANIAGIILFGIPEKKDLLGTDSYSENGIIQQAIRFIKQHAPDLLIMTDVCFCEYTEHGHCGVIASRGKNKNVEDVDNDLTLELLAKQAVSHVEAGADIVAPSGMIDGAVQTIRHALDHAGFKHIPILSYAVKYSSALYGPFREAAEGAPTFGDRRTHQMDNANSDEALREAAQDVAEAADMLMVKPAHAYLDIIYRIKQAHPGLPLGAYHVSGEYAMIKAAAERGWIDERKVALEILTSLHRAGADFIITYYAITAANWLRE